jgi:hypothetical protein
MCAVIEDPKARCAVPFASPVSWQIVAQDFAPLLTAVIEAVERAQHTGGLRRDSKD